MRIRSFLILLAAAGSAHAADSINIGHRTDSEEAKPMAWRFQLLEKALSTFEKRAAEEAPGAKLTFRLPKVDAAEVGNQVEIVGADHHVPLPMPSNTTFALKRGTLAEDDDSMVVVNRNFPKGEFNHPLVQVRSPGLPDGVRRMGDLRLACSVQMEMAKSEGLKFRAALAAASLFGFKVCDKLEAAKVEEPSGKYDTVTIEDGTRRLVHAAKDKHQPALGDKAWSDNARISYTLNGQPVL
ncbi:hypothetical protein SRABI118_00663 [Massilia sp. Bi118]|uniref:hypothetical protein n=1 Tax=Massilia sp. Bi118 TaxID=2822346 RepID=UPI001D6002BF|nr:hypothetical protein [Massilia sp. Bi118]CAH0157164.1 hypothetical protein SRABI118_00663 [Massilia sp. Bi118]